MAKIPTRLLNDPANFTGRPPATTRLQRLPYEDLAWEDFENLCCRLARKSADVIECRQFGVAGEAQDGIDLYGKRFGEERYTVFQCKREKKFEPAKIREAIELFLKGDWAGNSKEFVLCTQESLRNTHRSKELRLQKENLNGRGIELIVWDALKLDQILKDDPQTVYDFFDMPWCERFCGEERARQIKQRLPLPARNVFPKVEDYLARSITAIERSKDDPYFFSPGKSLEEVVFAEERIALLGPANYGKSTELKQLAYTLSASRNHYVFHLNLKNYTGRSIAESISHINDLPQDLIVVLLDGLDEVPSVQFDKVRRQVQEFSSKYAKVRIVISCRMNFYVAYLNGKGVGTLEGFKAYKLKDISYEQLIEYISKVKIDEKKLDKDAFLQEVKVRRFDRFIYLPHYLRLLTSEFIRTGQLANNILELTERFISESIRKDVDRYLLHEKAGKEIAIYNTLRKVAFVFECYGKNSASWSELQSFMTPQEIELLKVASTLIEGSESDDISWSFINNTIQEALVAGVLKDRSIAEIQKVTCFTPDFKRLKPSWVNVISMLISAVEDNRQLSIVNWLSEEQDDVVIRFESEVIDSRIRFDIFKRISKRYSEKQARINSWKFNIETLATFATSPMTASFLLNKLEVSEPSLVRADALQILSTYNIPVDFPDLADKLKFAIEANLYGVNNLPNLGIYAYCRCFRLNDIEFRRLFNFYKDSSDDGALASLYEGIIQQNRQDEYLGEILELIQIWMESDGMKSKTLMNIPTGLRECVKGAKSENSIVKIIHFMHGRLERIFYSSYFREIIDFTLRAAPNFRHNDDIYNGIVRIYLAEVESSRDSLNEAFIDYFNNVGRLAEVSKALYRASELAYPYRLIRFAEIANEQSIDFVIDEFANKRASLEDVTHIQNYLWRHEALVVRLNGGLNKTANIPKPERRDHVAEKSRQLEIIKGLLFSLDAIKVMMASFFEQAGATELTRDQIWRKMFVDERQYYPRLLYDALPRYVKSVTKKLAIETVERIWPRFWPKQLFDFLHTEKEVMLDEKQLVTVRDWCEEQLQKWRFTEVTSIGGAKDFDRSNAIIVSFFIRRLNLKTFSMQVYLDLLSFYRWNDRDIDVFDFVTSFVDADEIDETVLGNLRNQAIDSVALENHVKYIRQRKMTQATSFLIPYLVNPEIFRRGEVLEAFVELGGDFKELERILPDLDDNMEYKVILLFVNKPSEFVIQYLKKRARQHKKTSKGIYYAYCLSLFGNRRALRSVLESIQRTKEFPKAPGPGYVNFLAVSKANWMIPLLFRAFEMGYDKSIEQTHILNLREMAVSVLNEVCVMSKNFKVTRWIFKFCLWRLRFFCFISTTKSRLEIARDLDFYFELAEQKHYVSKGTGISLQEAVALFKKFT
jgi:hypothetical protein